MSANFQALQQLYKIKKVVYNVVNDDVVLKFIITSQYTSRYQWRELYQRS